VATDKSKECIAFTFNVKKSKERIPEDLNLQCHLYLLQIVFQGWCHNTGQNM